MTALVFSYVFPVLTAVLLLQTMWKRFGGSIEGWRFTLPAGTVVLALGMVHTGGIALARWPMALNANFSIPLTAAVFIKVLENILGKSVIPPGGLKPLWWFGVCAGYLLYPMAMGMTFFDPYSLGWGFSPLFIAVMLLTVVMLYKKQPLGLALLCCIAAYHLQLLESPNFWDYLVDPVYFFVSMGALIVGGVKGER